MEIGREPARLSAEHQHDVVRGPERRIPIEPARLCREKERLPERRKLRLECLPPRPDADVDVLPVVESCAFDLPFVEREAEGLDEMECRPCCETGATGVSGIPVDLGMNKDDVNAQIAACR